MFDFLLGFCAVVEAMVEGAGAIIAVNSKGPSREFVPKPAPTKEELEKAERRRLLEEAERKNAIAKANARNPKKQKIYSRDEVIAEMEAAKASSKVSPLEAWVYANDKIILSCLEPGTHLIKLENLLGVDIDALASFLLEQPTIESAEKTTEGLEIVSR